MFFIPELGPSIMTTILIVIGELQGCNFIACSINFLVLVNKLRDNSKSLKIMSPTFQDIITVYIYISVSESPRNSTVLRRFCPTEQL